MFGHVHVHVCVCIVQDSKPRLIRPLDVGQSESLVVGQAVAGALSAHGMHSCNACPKP